MAEYGIKILDRELARAVVHLKAAIRRDEVRIEYVVRQPQVILHRIQVFRSVRTALRSWDANGLRCVTTRQLTHRVWNRKDLLVKCKARRI